MLTILTDQERVKWTTMMRGGVWSVRRSISGLVATKWVADNIDKFLLVNRKSRRKTQTFQCFHLILFCGHQQLDIIGCVYELSCVDELKKSLKGVRVHIVDFHSVCLRFLHINRKHGFKDWAARGNDGFVSGENLIADDNSMSVNSLLTAPFHKSSMQVSTRL